MTITSKSPVGPEGSDDPAGVDGTVTLPRRNRLFRLLCKYYCNYYSIAAERGAGFGDRLDALGAMPQIVEMTTVSSSVTVRPEEAT